MAGMKPGQRLIHLKDESVRRLVQSEKAVERSFNEGRLMASLAVGLLLVGFLLVAQWRGNQTYSRQIERRSDQELVVIIQEMTNQNVTLREEVMRLQLRVVEAEQQTKGTSELLNEAAEELAGLKVMAGLAPAQGPGITVRIEDPQRVVLAQDFVALMHELLAGGAEAIAVNGKRVGGTSAFTDRDGRVQLDGQSLDIAYVVEAIGSPGDLEQSLTIPGGLESKLTAFPGVTTRIERSEGLRLAAATDETMSHGRSVEGE